MKIYMVQHIIMLHLPGQPLLLIPTDWQVLLCGTRQGSGAHQKLPPVPQAVSRETKQNYIYFYNLIVLYSWSSPTRIWGITCCLVKQVRFLLALRIVLSASISCRDGFIGLYFAPNCSPMLPVAVLVGELPEMLTEGALYPGRLPLTTGALVPNPAHRKHHLMTMEWGVVDQQLITNLARMGMDWFEVHHKSALWNQWHQPQKWGNISGLHELEVVWYGYQTLGAAQWGLLPLWCLAKSADRTAWLAWHWSCDQTLNGSWSHLPGQIHLGYTTRSPQQNMLWVFDLCGHWAFLTWWIWRRDLWALCSLHPRQLRTTRMWRAQWCSHAGCPSDEDSVACPLLNTLFLVFVVTEIEIGSICIRLHELFHIKCTEFSQSILIASDLADITFDFTVDQSYLQIVITPEF